jgi:Ser/Thr protein kinase RdoA (MazF antagonist)
LHEVIPFFHHTPRRLAALEAAARADAAGRCAGVQREVEFCLERRGLARRITDLLEAGRLPVRIAHNDTKLNNVMLDDVTGRAVCVIDLDTVMSGTVLYDFGDMIRSCARSSAEDERDLHRVTVRLDVVEALVRGYLEGIGNVLTAVELEHLALAGALVTYTIGVRFLADYLAGDVYFKTHRPGHNLDRARVHIKMVQELERLMPRIEAFVAAAAS